MAMRATARFITLFSKLRVVPTIDDQDRCVGEGNSGLGSQLCGCTGICVGTGWRAYVAEALHVSKKQWDKMQ